MFNQINANIESEKLDLNKLIKEGLDEKSIRYDTKLQNMELDSEETGGYYSYCSFKINKNTDEYIKYEIEFENFPFYEYDLMLVIVEYFKGTSNKSLKYTKKFRKLKYQNAIVNNS